MKKLNKMMTLLCGVSYAYAMDELVSIEKKQTHYGSIGWSNVSEYKPQQWAPFIRDLPVEVQYNIFAKIVNVANSKVRNIPLLLGLKFYHEWSELESRCPFNFGNRDFSAAELFCIPKEKRDKFFEVSRYNAEIWKAIGLPESGIMQSHHYDEAMEILPAHLKQGLRVHIYRYRRPVLDYIPSGSALVVGAIGLGFAIYAVVQSSSNAGIVGGICFAASPIVYCCFKARVLLDNNLNPSEWSAATVQGEEV